MMIQMQVAGIIGSKSRNCGLPGNPSTARRRAPQEVDPLKVTERKSDQKQNNYGAEK